jgi:hypothetical protein
MRAPLLKFPYYVMVGFLGGLILKFFMLFYKGVFDMDAYYEWGRRTLETNLAKGYGSIYFPLQYQIFEFLVWIGRALGSGPILTFKASNLFFDIGTFFVLLLLLKRERLNPGYALLYWLHPWFLSVFSLGYVDFHFSFFVIFSVYLLRDDTARHYLIAGIPLGAAFLMKPQTQILIVAAFFFAICHCVRTRTFSSLGIFAGPVSFFLGYEAYFAASNIPSMGFKPAHVLPLSYLNIVNVFPSLTAQMPNFWYPIAYFLKKPGDPIYVISNQILILANIPAKWIAAAAVLIVLGFCVWRVEKDAATIGNKFIRIFGAASLLVPMFMTSAHENHLFLGSLFLVLLAAANTPLSVKLAAQVLLVIQFLNISGLYAEHPARLATFLHRIYSEQAAVAYAVISLLCFAAIFGQLIARSGKKLANPGSS